MTEEEAETKTCTLSCASPEGPWVCVASKCMAWRWAAPHETKEGGTFWPEMHMIDGVVVVSNKRQFIYRGYCGLAGKVE